MPSLLDIRRRVRAVRSTQQITKAMKMVAASKMRRAQDRVVGARPFAQAMLRVLNSVATRVEAEAHPLLAPPTESGLPTLLIVITADKGLCGSFNTNVAKAALSYASQNANRAVATGLVGRRGRDFFRRRRFDVRYEKVGLFGHLKFEHAQDIARAAIAEIVEGRVSSVYLVYNEFKSVMQQRVAIERLLPIARLEVEESGRGPQVDYLYEPGPEAILSSLVPRHVEVQVYRALLESEAAEQAARMMAMDAATRNAGEMIDKLTLNMNKVRQAAITREIIEVVSGAQGV
jgi:F-type H+-transporting ATPase subunit gamma